jgi:hypothetical protein
MVKQELLDILLLQGVQAWNEWKRENPSVQIELVKAELGEANLIDVDLSECDLREANLSDSNLNGSDLRRADLSEARFIGATLKEANLSEVNLGYARLDSADFRGTDLKKTSLIGADLRGTGLDGADLRGADLRGTDLSDADLGHADLSHAILMHTKFGNVDLSTVKGLETVQHSGPSTIGIDTIYRSHGKIPEAFLKGAGVPATFIDYMRSIVDNPIDYYSCFISYSGIDQAFAEMLYADLQSKGVRCWFAPHDMRIGDEIRPRIDESIQIHDKLLLVLSESSLASNWVKKEVETAFEKETQQQKQVLFPIRLDNTVMLTQEAWGADIRRMRHIGDFQLWKDHDEYQKAFARLLRDLQTAP